MTQWIWCIIIGSTGLVISLLTKIVYAEPTEAEIAQAAREKAAAGQDGENDPYGKQ